MEKIITQVNNRKYFSTPELNRFKVLKELMKQKKTTNQLIKQGFSQKTISELELLIPSCIKKNGRNQLCITEFGKQYYQSSRK